MLLLACKLVAIIPFMSVNLVILVNLMRRPHLHSVFNVGYITQATLGVLATPTFLSSSLDLFSGYIYIYSEKIEFFITHTYGSL